MAARSTTASGSGGAGPRSPLTELPARDRETGLVHVLVDTPKGSPTKFKVDLEKGCYTIAHVLPPGAVFPFDFGSIPRTAAEDGDPMDVLVLMEWPSFPGCLVPVRLIGALEAEQTQEGQTNRNDRLIGVAAESREYGDVKNLSALPGKLLSELEHFFVSYNEERGRRFRVLRRSGRRRAVKLLESGERRFRAKARGGGPARRSR
jgi:inorganic pyrophosphatase